MTKKEIVYNISEKLIMDKKDILAILETFMEEVKNSIETGDNVYLRGFGTFSTKTRKEKKARDILKKRTVIIPAHKIPVFKPCEEFKKRITKVKTNL